MLKTLMKDCFALMQMLPILFLVMVGVRGVASLLFVIGFDTGIGVQMISIYPEIK